MVNAEFFDALEQLEKETGKFISVGYQLNYSRDVLARQAGLLRDTFPGFDFLFSVKANPFPPVMRALAALASTSLARAMPMAS